MPEKDLDIFDKAIEAHVRWKLRLKSYISGRSEENFDPDVVQCDDKCALGQWIYGEGSKLKGVDHFENTKDSHARFHLTAADIVRKVDSGDTDGATELLTGYYSNVSNEVVRNIVLLKRDIDL